MDPNELKLLTKEIQEMAGVPPEDRDGGWGPQTAGAVVKKLESLGVKRPKREEQKPAADGHVLKGDGTWPFTARIEGDDIVCEDIVVTCFGGWGNGNNADPQDNGNTASGRNTKHEAIDGVSIAMDARMFPNMEQRDRPGYNALKGAPFPRIPWGTPVEVTINGVTHTPKDGIVDLGPGKRASKPGAAHALDLTPIAAKKFAPAKELRSLATSFYARGSFRIIGGAQYAKA